MTPNLGTSLRLPVRRVVVAPDADADPATWPGTVPAVRQLLRDGGLDLGVATLLVGENGSGKSTLVEAIAMAYGLNAEGGSPHARHETRATESGLHRSLRIARGVGSRWGFFLRAETMHGLYSYLEEIGTEAQLHEVSHGESFLEILRSRFSSPGFYVLDEPESALSFSGCLALIALLSDLLATGTSQVLVATHSPVVASLPGARILELDGEGWHQSTWADLQLVGHYRRFLNAPQSYLRHLD